MFEFVNLILIFVTYSQTYPQKLWIKILVAFLAENT